VPRLLSVRGLRLIWPPRSAASGRRPQHITAHTHTSTTSRPTIQSINPPPFEKKTKTGQLVKDGWRVLDVRPPGEVAKVWIDGAATVPAYLPETRNDPGSLIKRLATWGNGGWWVGATHMNSNPDFAAEVQRQLPKDARVLAVCQTGIRSLAAAERLAALGYGDVAWLDGGLDETKAGDLPTRPEGKDPR
jgi:rhodanese-related sulfurtransferase